MLHTVSPKTVHENIHGMINYMQQDTLTTMESSVIRIQSRFHLYVRKYTYNLFTFLHGDNDLQCYPNSAIVVNFPSLSRSTACLQNYEMMMDYPASIVLRLLGKKLDCIFHTVYTFIISRMLMPADWDEIFTIFPFSLCSIRSPPLVQPPKHWFFIISLHHSPMFASVPFSAFFSALVACESIFDERRRGS